MQINYTGFVTIESVTFKYTCENDLPKKKKSLMLLLLTENKFLGAVLFG